MAKEFGNSLFITILISSSTNIVHFSHERKLAHLQSSVGSYPKILRKRNMKIVRSDTPRSCARKAFILELSDSAEAFVERAMK